MYKVANINLCPLTVQTKTPQFLPSFLCHCCGLHTVHPSRESRCRNASLKNKMDVEETVKKMCYIWEKKVKRIFENVYKY